MSVASQTLTFLFSDLRDYTRFVEQHGDTAATTLIRDYRTIVRAEVAKLAGAEIKTEGDSFYVVFTSARAAVSCGVAILREAERYSRGRPDRPMKVGVGIHAGEPVPHEGQYVGAAVIVAARLAQSASAGELLVTEVVRALLPRDGALSMEQRAGLQLKGIADAPQVFTVRWAVEERPAQRDATPGVSIAAAEPRSRQLLCPEVIGRGDELATLEAHLAEAVAGRGRTVLVGGDAGLGKSALLRQFGERATAGGARVIVGECSEVEARRPFGPVIDAFTHAGIPLPDELAQGAPGAQPAAETERYRVHAGFSARLTAASAAQPVVLVIEDLHWGDEATYELVPFLARKLRDRAVLIVATYRTDELHRTHPLNHVLAELARGRLADEVRLRRLTSEELGEMVKLALGLTRATTREFRDALYARTEGNPFFVEEILRALVEKGELEYREGSWRRTKAVAELAIPVSVRDAVQQRLVTMPESAREIVQVAAVIGQRFEFDLLREVSGRDEAAVFEAIRAAIDAQLLAEEPEAEQESYRFRHALSRESVLSDLLARERRLLHRKVGEAIERRTRRRTEDLAYHFDEARDPRALSYHAAAADEAIAAYAYSRAAHHLERAIEIAPDDDASLGPLYQRLANASIGSGELQRAARAAERAIEALGDAGSDVARADATITLAWLRWHGGDSTAARALADDAVRALEPGGPGRSLARGLAELARIDGLGGRDPDGVIAMAERAAEMARQLGEPDLEAEALVTVGTAMSNAERPGGPDVIRRALDLADRHGAVWATARAYNNLSVTLIREGASQEEIDRVMDLSVAHAERYGYRSDTLQARQTTRAFARLDWDRALAIVDESETDTVWAANRELVRAAILTFRAGPTPDVRARADDAARRLEASGSPQWRATALLVLVTHGLAGDDARAVSPEVIEELGSFALFAPYAVAAGLQSAYRTSSVELLKRWRDVSAGGSDLARPAELLGAALIARSEGSDDDALARLRELKAARVRRAHFYLRSIAAQHEAELLVRRGDRDGAKAAADAAREPFRTAGATWYLGELDRWAREAGIE